MREEALVNNHSIGGLLLLPGAQPGPYQAVQAFSPHEVISLTNFVQVGIHSIDVEVVSGGATSPSVSAFHHEVSDPLPHSRRFNGHAVFEHMPRYN